MKLNTNDTNTMGNKTVRRCQAATVGTPTPVRPTKAGMVHCPAVRALLDERVRRERERIESELERLGRGLTPGQKKQYGLALGHTLFTCSLCGTETVYEARLSGWLEGRHGGYLCTDCLEMFTPDERSNTDGDAQ